MKENAIKKLLKTITRWEYFMNFSPLILTLGLASISKFTNPAEYWFVLIFISIFPYILVLYIYRAYIDKKIETLLTHRIDGAENEFNVFVSQEISEIEESFQYGIVYKAIILLSAVFIYMCGAVGESILQKTLLDSDGITLKQDYTIYFKTYIALSIITMPFFALIDSVTSLGKGTFALKKIKKNFKLT